MSTIPKLVAPKQLAFTGFDVGWVMLLGGVMVGCGVGFARLARRARNGVGRADG